MIGAIISDEKLEQHRKPRICGKAVMRTDKELVVVGRVAMPGISRAGRILTRLKAMVPLTVRDTVACPLRALPARSFFLTRTEGI